MDNTKPESQLSQHNPLENIDQRANQDPKPSERIMQENTKQPNKEEKKQRNNSDGKKSSFKKHATVKLDSILEN